MEAQDEIDLIKRKGHSEPLMSELNHLK